MIKYSKYPHQIV